MTTAAHRLARYLDPMNRRQRLFLIYLAVGLACGLVAVAFHLAIDGLFNLVVALQSDLPRGLALLAMILTPALGGLLVGLVLRMEPAAVGSGIPQTKAAYHRPGGTLRLREGVWRFVVGTLSVGTGASLGREGPTVHLCASLASAMGRLFRLRTRHTRGLIPVGMGAGIAAAFNAPLAAVVFVVEELLHQYETRLMGGIVFAAVIAAGTERLILGTEPVYHVHLPDFAFGWWMLVALPIGITAGLVGHAFLATLLQMRRGFRGLAKVPSWVRPGLGGLGVGLTGTLVLVLTSHNGVFGLGYGDMNLALNGELVWSTLLLLVVGKFIATLLSYASGGSGGLFAPTLFIGTSLGGLFGVALTNGFSLPPEIIGGSALLGMGALFAAIIRCPFTSVLIIYEMTGSYSLILPLMFGNMIAFNLASHLHRVPLYDALLRQDGIRLRPPRRPSRT